MTDESDNKEAKDGEATSAELCAGERLADARRQQEISVNEVAKELHLDERKVRALENNDFEVLGAPVFAKGHLRKYAQLVGVSKDDVLADYYELNRSAGMPPVVGKVRKPARELTPGPWLAAIVVIIVVVSVYWFLAVRESEPEAPPDNSESALLDAEPPLASSEEAAADAAIELPAEVPVQEDTSAAAEIAEPTPAAATPPPVETPVADGEVRLSVTFTGDCWTEITDANGRRLFFDLGRDGRNVSISGQAPLSVLFGNADNVAVRVNGDDYTISAADRRGQTARLTIRAR